MNNYQTNVKQNSDHDGIGRLLDEFASNNESLRGLMFKDSSETKPTFQLQPLPDVQKSFEELSSPRDNNVSLRKSTNSRSSFSSLGQRYENRGSIDSIQLSQRVPFVDDNSHELANRSPCQPASLSQVASSPNLRNGGVFAPRWDSSKYISKDEFSCVNKRLDNLENSVSRLDIQLGRIIELLEAQKSLRQ
eukprot:TRINITY_DN968_c0_g3_i1.p1 TRINITY_DN968_c0_g3~~TRINITY_DN968_c0_g3_i1.p1  ORF type:complete len:191 (+),score=44.64 TRINITY_DN968_c0_g3_i1:159-731(+)